MQRGVSKIKPLPIVLLAAMLLSVTVAACGGSSVHTGTSPTGGYLKYDGDNDRDDRKGYNGANNDDRYLFATYGKEATPAETRAVATLMRSYYTLATAENGAAACALLYPSLAAGLAESGHPSAHSTGNDCAAGVSPLLKEQHHQLVADEASTMVVTSLHVKGAFGLVGLGFKSTPEVETLLEREAGTWKLASLFGSQMP